MLNILLPSGCRAKALYDKAGLSGVLNIPVPPGATLSVQMSTWCNPCHGVYEVEKSSCFGVGMVPFGSGKEQMWSRAGLETVIEDGVQYHACMAYEKMMFGGGGVRLGLGGMAALLGGGGSPDNLFEYSLDVMQEGTSIRHSSKTKLSLEVIDVRIRRDAAGVSEFSFSHGDDLFKVKRPAGAENKDMQLYFNCLSDSEYSFRLSANVVVTLFQ